MNPKKHWDKKLKSPFCKRNTRPLKIHGFDGRGEFAFAVDASLTRGETKLAGNASQAERSNEEGGTETGEDQVT